MQNSWPAGFLNLFQVNMNDWTLEETSLKYCGLGNNAVPQWWNARSHNHGNRAIVSFVSTRRGDYLGSIKCCCVSCRINTAIHGWRIKSSLGADNALSAPEFMGFPFAVASVSATCGVLSRWGIGWLEKILKLIAKWLQLLVYQEGSGCDKKRTKKLLGSYSCHYNHDVGTQSLQN